MSVFLSPVGGAGAQFFDNNGNPLTGGKLYTYAAGTTTPQATYTSAAGSTFHTNPIVLDAAGRVPGSSEIWLADNQIYKFVLKDSNDVLLATWDQITGVNSNFVNYTTETEVQTATAGQTVFTLTTMSYAPGTGSLTVYVDGVNQYEGDSYLETNSTTVTFTVGLHVGALVKFTTAVQTTGNATDASVVTYTAPYTGAIQYTVESKLAQYVSVKDFGAVGDGTTDDTAAIQTAMDALSAGQALYFPAGTYRLTSALVLSVADVKLYGDGRNSVLYNDTPMDDDNSQGTSTLTFTTAATGVHIVDLKFYGDQEVGPLDTPPFEGRGTGHNIYFTGNPVNGWRAVVERCLLVNGYQGVTVENGASDVKIINCDFINHEHCVGIFEASDVIVSDCRGWIGPARSSLGFRQRDITIHMSQNVSIDNCQFDGAYTAGVYLRMDVGYTSDLANINISNYTVSGRNGSVIYGSQRPNAGIYFECAVASGGGTYGNINISNLVADYVVNAVLYNGGLTAGPTAIQPTGINLSNITVNECSRSFQHTQAQFTGNSPGLLNSNISNVTVTGNATYPGSFRFKGDRTSISNVNLNEATATFDVSGSNNRIENVIDGGLTQEESISTNGLLYALSGTLDGSGAASIAYPTGFTRDTTVVVAAQAQNPSTVWRTEFFASLGSSISYAPGATYANQPYYILIALK